jgi:hypothetical protein
MAFELKLRLERATVQHKTSWMAIKKEKFTERGLDVKLVQLLGSLEARKIPQIHCERPRCLEQGISLPFDNIKEFADHVKDKHKAGWMDARDTECAIMSEVLGVRIVRGAQVQSAGGVRL